MFFCSDRQSERNDGSAECLLCTLERGAKIGVLFVELGDYHDARDHELVGIGPRLFGLYFNALNTVDHDDGAIGDAECGACVRNEGGVPGRIYKIKLCIAMFEMCEGGV